jgi:hypothetical protein
VVETRPQFDGRKTVSKLSEYESLKFGEANAHQTVLKLVGINQYGNENSNRGFPSSKTIEVAT